MELETLMQLLDVQKRRVLFDKILDKLREIGNLEFVKYEVFETSEGRIPVITITKLSDLSEVKNVKVFVGAQHNEYNGLFGILDLLKQIQKQQILMVFLIPEKTINQDII